MANILRQGEDPQDQCFPNVLLVDAYWLRKITTDPHILVHVNIVSG